MSGLAHLNEAAAAALDLAPAERIDWFRNPRWIGYSRSKEILTKLEDLLQHPRIHRMPCSLLVGKTNNGKTMIVHRFEQLHPARQEPGQEYAVVPVLLVQAPPAPDENRLYARILSALSFPYKPTESAGKRQDQVLNVLRLVGIRILIIDEIHHMLAGGSEKHRHFLHVLKYLANELQIPIVGVGTLDALRAIQTDEQLANRFEPLPLPSWALDRDFQRLLASFERTLPLREPSGLSNERLAARLLSLSQGTIGELSALLTQAAAHAIRTGRERIDEEALGAIGWVPPSDRRQRAERVI